MSKKSTNTYKNKRPKVKFRHKHPIIAGFFATCIVLGLIASFIAVVYVKNVLDLTPEVNERMLKSASTSNIYDSEGKIIASLSDVKQDYVKNENIPQVYKDFLLSTEDRDFYKTRGVSIKGLANAAISVVQSKILHRGVERGGSTIDQQLIKYSVFSTSDADRTINRKIQEIWLSTQMNKNYSKDQILEWYINKINMGEGSYGADTIAITYFGKHLKDFEERTPQNLSKLALIAGLGQAPSAYNLYDDPELVQKRRDVVLLSALNNGKISQQEYEETKKVDIKDGLKERYWRNNEINQVALKYNDYIQSTRNQLIEMGYNLETDSIQVYTALNRSQYDWLLETVKNPEYFQDDQQEVAVTVVDVQSGYVIAQAGGRDLDGKNQYNRAIQNTRSSGSSIKPFIEYGPAIEYLNKASNTQLDSSPYTYPGTNLVANNFGGATYGIVTMQQALRMSLNTPSIRLLDEVGPDRAKAFMDKTGFKNIPNIVYAGSDALGVNASTEQLAYAFAAIANGGMIYEPSYITKIVYSDGSEKEIKPKQSRAMKDSTSFILASMLKGVTQPDGSAPNAAIPEFAGMITKTGTVGYDPALGMPSNAASDVWMNGSTKSVAVSIWSGYDNPNEPGHYVSDSSQMKQKIYKDIMKHYNEGKDTSDWKQPESVQKLSGDGLNAFYAPLDQNEVRSLPTLDESAFQFNLPESVKNTDKQFVTPPKDYEVNKWVIDLKGEDKEIYQYWKSNDYSSSMLPSVDQNYLFKENIFSN